MRYLIHILYPSHPDVAVSEGLSPSYLVRQKMRAHRTRVFVPGFRANPRVGGDWNPHPCDCRA